MISTDRNVFEEGSEARSRMLEYGMLVRELHIIVFSRRSLGLERQKIGDNVWLYPTSSFSRLLYIFDAIRIGRKALFIEAGAEISGERIVLEERLADLVTAQDPFECGLAGWRLAKKLRVPLHLQVHTDFLSPFFTKQSLMNKIRLFLAKFLFPRADGGVRVVAQFIKDAISERMHFRFGAFPPISILPVYVDVDAWRNAVPSFKLREKYPEYTHIILVVARLEREKGVDAAIEIFASLSTSAIRNPGLVIVGTGSEMHALKQRAQALSLGERVKFEGWSDDLVPYYKAADLLLVTSHYEGYGRQIFEAAASGCPVLTPDVGIGSEIASYWNRPLCRPLDSECLSRMLGAWYESPDAMQALALSAKARAKELAKRAISKEEFLLRYQKMWEDAAGRRAEADSA